MDKSFALNTGGLCDEVAWKVMLKIYEGFVNFLLILTIFAEQNTPEEISKE